MRRALICAQAFPPLLKQAGGVAKDYLALCRALIDGLGWQVTLLSPVSIAESGEADVERWLTSGQLVHVPVWALQASNALGVAVLMDFFSVHNTCRLVWELLNGGHALCFIDDSCMRIAPLMLMRGLGIPGIASTHSDVPSHPVYQQFIMLKILWWLHLASAYFATLHASVAHVYANSLWERYRIPVDAVWPPVLWSDAFRRPLHDIEEAALSKRACWIQELGFEPKAIFLFAGRWSAEKRIHLLHDAIPQECALIIVGDSDADYADQIEASTRHNVLPKRGMLGAEDLRIAYAASDLFVSASTCETLGNTIVEAWSAGIPVAVHPVGGHLEFVKDNENSYLVNFDSSEEARDRLSAIVAGGAKASVEPDLSKMGDYFRTLDFPSEIQRRLLEPALSAAASWQALTGWRWVVEKLIRILLLLACCLIWPVTVVWSRAYFAISCDPIYRYVEPGTAKEPDASNRSPGHGAVKEFEEDSRLALLNGV